MQDYKVQLQNIEDIVNDRKIKKAQFTERLTQYQNEKQGLINELNHYGIKEEGLQAWIEKEKQEREKQKNESST